MFRRRIRRRQDDGRKKISIYGPSAAELLNDEFVDKKPYKSNTVFFGGGYFVLSEWNSQGTSKNSHLENLSPFYCSYQPITNREYFSVITPLRGESADAVNDNPALVSWWSAVRYCNERSYLEGLEPCYTIEKEVKYYCNNNGYRLPTDAEMGYALFGFKYLLGTEKQDVKKLTKKFISLISDHLEPHRNMVKHNLEKSEEDIWCWDYYQSDYYKNSPVDDPEGPRNGRQRVVRNFYKTANSQTTVGKPFRGGKGSDFKATFFVVRSWMFENEVILNNIRVHIPQWDQKMVFWLNLHIPLQFILDGSREKTMGISFEKA